MMASLSETVKIFFPIDEYQWHGMDGESLWATPISRKVYLVENNPLYVYGISYHDQVVCDFFGDTITFISVYSKGGHSNYRILLKSGRTVGEFLERWKSIEELGCSYESSSNPQDVFAIDVPPDSDVRAVYDLLVSGENEGIWHLDEGNFEHKL